MRRNAGYSCAPGAARAVALLCVLLLALPAAFPGVGGRARAEEQGRVTGRLTGNPEKGSLEGATVVLLRFRAGEDGKPEGGPLGRQVAGKDGAFAFENVPIDRKAAYQLGTRVDGNLVASQPFSFPPGKVEVRMDLPIPDLKRDTSQLVLGRAFFVLEARVGRLWVTELLHLENPTKVVMDSRQTPLELPLPAQAEELEILELGLQEGSHERVGAKLLVFGKIRPGTNTVAFRYVLPSGLGGVRMEWRYTLPVVEAQVVVPAGSLKVSGERLRSLGRKKMGGQTYDAWGAGELPPSAVLRIEVSGVPVRQWIYLAPLAGFFAVMAAVVFWFMRRRLGAAG